MSSTSELSDPKPVAVVVANATYTDVSHPALPSAVADARRIVDLLRDEHGFNSSLLADLSRGELLDRFETALATGSNPGGNLVVVWVGHGEPGDDGSLRLIVRGPEADGEAYAAGRLGELAAKTGARQILVVIDTCYAGAGATAAVTLADTVMKGRADQRGLWFGVLAAARDRQKAVAGALTAELIRILSEGPHDPVALLGWAGPTVSGHYLVDAVMREWSERRHLPKNLEAGVSLGMLRNVRYTEGAIDDEVDHLLQSARGTSTIGDFFSGREGPLAEIVAWLGTGRPGLFIVTGPPGTGKSAVLGRIVSLSVSAERSRVMVASSPAPELDPGESSVDARLNARGLDVKSAAGTLARQLGLDDGAGPFDVLALAARRFEDGDPLVVVIDGLNEAGDTNARAIALELVVPLKAFALVLVGTRELLGGDQEPSLLALLGAAAATIDLGADVKSLLDDIERYVVRRLAGVSPDMDPEVVAAEVRRLAAAAEATDDGPFLLARLITSSLRNEPVDTSGEHWRGALSTNVGAAFERDLAATALVVGGTPEPTAARELLAALGYAHGAGFPIDLWAVVASSLSPSGFVYRQAEVYALLAKLGRYVVRGIEGDLPVYRIAHQRLAEHLLPMSTAGSVDDETATRLAAALVGTYRDLISQGLAPVEHPYLWRYAWRHCADADQAGIDLLRALVEVDTVFELDLALALARVGRRRLWAGRAQDAVAPLQEAADFWRVRTDDSELVVALHELAIAQSSAGRSDEADRISAEAAGIAEQWVSDPARAEVLAGALLTRAIVLLRNGAPYSAEELGMRAAGLFGESAADRRAAALSITATACTILGELARGESLANEGIVLLTELPESADDERDPLRVELLTTLARIQLLRLVQGDGPIPEPRDVAAIRFHDLLQSSGATHTMLDIVLAEGLRLLASITVQLALRGVDVAAMPAPSVLLADARKLLEPFEAANLEARTALAAVAVVDATATATSEGMRGMERVLPILDRAERLLRPDSANPAVAMQLGEVLHMQVAIHRSLGSAAEELVDRQVEAVEFLQATEGTVLEPMLIASLVELTKLLVVTGQIERAAQVAYLRAELADVAADSEAEALRIGQTLCEAAELLSVVRPLESMRLATRALALLEPIPESPDVACVRGWAMMCTGLAHIAIGENQAGRDALRRSLAVVPETSDQIPEAFRLRLHARTLLVLGAVDLDEGDAENALMRVEDALEIAQQTWPAADPLVVDGRIARVRALAALGRWDEVEDLGSDLAELQGLVDFAQPLSMVRLALALDAAGQARWEATLQAFDDRPAVQRRLALLRRRPPSETSQFIDAAVDVIEAGEDDGEARQIVRMRRVVDPAGFDPIWTERVGPLPVWLLVPPAAVHEVVAWFNADSPELGIEILQRYPRILDPRTDVVLDEIASATQGGLERAAELKRIRATAAASGVGAAYRPILAESAIQGWVEADLSREHLTAERAELLSEGVSEWLREALRDAELDPFVVCAWAMLELVRNGEESLAFLIMQDPDEGLSRLAPAWRSSHVARLRALAVLVLMLTPVERAGWRHGAIALAIATAVSDDESDELAWDSIELAEMAVEDLEDTDLANALAADVLDAATAFANRFDRIHPIMVVVREAIDRLTRPEDTPGTG